MGNCATCQNCNGEKVNEFNDDPSTGGQATVDVRQSLTMAQSKTPYQAKTNNKYVSINEVKFFH